MKKTIRIGMLGIALALILGAAPSFSLAQDYTQTVRGQVIDIDGESPLVGAAVFVLNSDPPLGAYTDVEGNFRIAGVPVGRCDLKISYLGYEDKVMPNLLLGSAKEMVLTVGLTEKVVKLDEVIITAQERKGEVVDEMATVSARTFSTEETSRYAGTFNDPARMASSFAGVTSNAEGNNDIVVRGNSSKGILWRMDGIEIPNPNHFADEGATGGPISALNGAMLANSDFFSGAFPAAYGNAYSGVFDVRLRKGNNEKREYAFSIGVLGTDFTLEGPFSKKSQASYLVNYRYSSLALLDGLGIVDFDGVPKYQDASFKIHVPTKKAGVFSLFGLGGYSSIDQVYNDSLDQVVAKNKFNARLGVVGLNHTFFLSDNTSLRSFVSASESGSFDEYHEDHDQEILKYQYGEDYSKPTLRFGTTLNSKINARNTIRGGAIYSVLGYKLFTEYFDSDADQMITEVDRTGSSGTVQGFLSWKHRLSDRFSVTSGLHYLHFMLNDKASIEPRLGMRWQVSQRGTISAGLGMHSKMETMTYYFARHMEADGSFTEPNRDLGMAKAMHYVLGYDHSFNNTLRLKVELYYQQLWNVPIDKETGSAWSALNSTEGFTTRELVNEGTGRNYGLELTFEKFFSNRFFYMITGSLYESKYTAMDGVERDSRFNGNYTGNLILGKEFRLGKPEKHRTLGLSTKIAFIGGHRYTAIDLPASVEAGYSVYQTDQPWAQKADDIFKANLAVYYRKERKKVSSEVKMDIQNATNHAARVWPYYNPNTEAVEWSVQLPILPVLSYKLEF